MKTTWTSQKDIDREWYLVDATDQRLGRISTKIAALLIGKEKPSRVPNMDCGDYVVVINVDKLAIDRKKLRSKKYYRHSGYGGGFKEETLEQLIARKPKDVLRRSVKNMLPKTKLQSSMIARLNIYTGSEHSHEAQKPKEIKLTSKK